MEGSDLGNLNKFEYFFFYLKKCVVVMYKVIMDTKNIKDVIKNIIDLPDDQLIEIHKKYINNKDTKKQNKEIKEEIEIKKDDDEIDGQEQSNEITVEVDKTTDKYKIFLEFINAILKNINKNAITDLTQFIDIDQKDIKKPENITTLDNMSKKLGDHFNMTKCGYVRKTENIVTNVIRGMCKSLKLKFVNRIKKSTKNYVIEYHYLYSIKNL